MQIVKRMMKIVEERKNRQTDRRSDKADKEIDREWVSE